MKSIITVHATLTPARVNWSLFDVTRRDRVHGFSRVGCHYVVNRDGAVERGRPLDSPSMYDAIEVANDAICVCLIGGGDGSGGTENNFTPEQRQALRGLIREHNIAEDKVRCRIPGLELEDIL